jgi:hypothetical protein
VRKILTLRVGSDERELLELAAEGRGISLGSFVRDSALAAARAELVSVVEEELPETPAVREAEEPSGARRWFAVFSVRLTAAVKRRRVRRRRWR